MYDCFNMAYQDNANPLQLHIKINTENLLPVPQKYNAGSLRLPADPSWPKIPQRKLINDVDPNDIEHPCIVTLTGTPRRSRTVVHTPLNQSPKSTVTKDSAYFSFHQQKTISSTHVLKRVPGYADPRFKKVTNVKRSQLVSTESLQTAANQSDATTYTEHPCRKEIGKPMLDRNINMAQKTLQESDKSREEHKVKSVENSGDTKTFNMNQLHRPVNNSALNKMDNTSNDTNNNQIAEEDKCVKNVDSSHISKATVNDANTQVNIAPLTVQENNGQLFFVLDKKMQSHPLNAIHVDTITVPQDCVKHCYNVQLPVLAYQNIPMQIASTSASNVMHQCLNYAECHNQNNTSSLVRRESEQHVCSDRTQTTSKSLGNDAEDNKIQEKNTTQDSNAPRVQSNVPEENKKGCLKLDQAEKASILEKLQSSNIQRNAQESSDSEYYIPNISKKNVYNSTLKRLKMNKIPYQTSSEETTDSEFIGRKSVQKKQFSDTLHGDQIKPLAKEKENRQLLPKSKETVNDKDQSVRQHYKVVACESKMRNKSEQNLVCAKTECTRKLCRNSEPHITFKQKKASAKFSRKARSYFQKNSHSALVDSDYTLVWPNCQYTKYKRNQSNACKFGNPKKKKNNQHFNPAAMHERTTGAQVDNTSNFIEQNYAQDNDHLDSTQEVTKSLSKPCVQQDHCKCEVSPRSNTDDVFQRPKAIPPKTQELLNKSYWEYYNKLKHKMRNTECIEQQYPYHLTKDTLEKGKKGKPSDVHDKELRNESKVNPELQTLQQCTALSTMINKALDSNLQSDVMQTKELFSNDTAKPSLNRMISMQNVNAKKISALPNDKFPFKNTKCNEHKTTVKQFLELRSIIFFGGMVYIFVIFLPMLYDYFYYEEYDDYENLSYMELIVDYILSSFKEAFGGIFDGVKQIFFYPVRL